MQVFVPGESRDEIPPISTTPFLIQYTTVLHGGLPGEKGYIQYIQGDILLSHGNQQPKLVGFLHGHKILLTEAKKDSVFYLDLFDPHTSFYQLGNCLFADAKNYVLRPELSIAQNGAGIDSDLLILDGFEVMPEFNAAVHEKEFARNFFHQFCGNCHLLVAMLGEHLSKEMEQVLVQDLQFVRHPGISQQLLFAGPPIQQDAGESSQLSSVILESGEAQQLAQKPGKLRRNFLLSMLHRCF